MDIKLEDLWTTCSECKGTGYVTKVQSTGAVAGITSFSDSGPCKNCQGLGGKMTPSGEAVGKFLGFARRAGLV